MIAKDFILNLPNSISADAISGMSSVFHFDISGANGGQYTVNINDGKATVTEGLIGDSSCAVKASDDTLAGLLDKTVNPMTAMMMGKIKISNLGEMMKYAKILGLM